MIRAATEPPTYVSPPQVAERLAVNADKVLTWIRSGELHAVNVATRPAGRPRWRIAVADLEMFLSARSAKPPAPVTRTRRRTDSAVTEYF